MTQTHSLEYQVWNGMMARCYRPANNRFAAYGARGIRVCEGWQDFTAFVSDMGPRPPGASIDRIDNSKGYEPANCRWATAVQQASNQKKNVMIEMDGELRCLAEWCELKGINYKSAWAAIRKRGRPAAEVLQ